MLLIRSGNIVDGSPLVKNLKRTADLTTNLFLYSSGITIDSQILSIDSATQITLSKNAYETGTKSLQITNAKTGVFHERNCALEDAKFYIDERGDLIQFIYRNEAQVTRDRYSSIKAKSTTDTKYYFRAHPVEFRPSTRKLEKAGLREEADVTVYTAMKDWIDLGIDFKDIDPERSSVKLQGDTFEIREKGLSGQFNDTFLYITFGLFKK